MTDRRPSLIDQMALVAAMEADFDSSDQYTDDFSRDDLLDDDDLEHPNERAPPTEMVFNTLVPQEAEKLDALAQQSLMSRGYQGRPTTVTTNITTEEGLAGTDDDDDEVLGPVVVPPPRRQSYSRPSRRTSYQSSEGSWQSAPARTGNDPPSPAGSLYGANAFAETTARRRNSSTRRSSFNMPMGRLRNTSSDDDSLSAGSTPSSNSALSRFGRLTSLGVRRNNHSRANSASESSTTLNQALDCLSTHGSNSEWENVAAAVTVVAAGSQGTGAAAKALHIKFAVDDTVLVLLTLLNVTNMEDPKDTFTVAPVNRFGFPQGEGRTEEEKCGPYTFVFATVKHVHFDEDDRYYTIVRADTGTEQRADSGWIEPLQDPVGIEAASRAATRTVRSAQEKPPEEMEEVGYLRGVFDCFFDILSWPAEFGRSTLHPWYRRLRTNAKYVVSQFVYGEAPFACQLQFTGINFLVLCSFAFVFLETFSLAFLPADYDRSVAKVGVFIWGILVLELLFEILIRPTSYFDLIRSDRAYAPSTARHINTFHIFFETLALLTYVPEFACITGESDDVCDRDQTFSRVQASIDSVLGDSRAHRARAKFFLGLTALRLFGLVRHWKWMFLNSTFKRVKREGLEKLLIPLDKVLGDSFMKVGANNLQRDKKNDDDLESMIQIDDVVSKPTTSSEEDQRLRNAATVGTALMVVNSQRTLVLLTGIVLVLPLLQCVARSNPVAKNLVHLLQAHNLAAPSDSLEDCAYLESAVKSWVRMAAAPQPNVMFSHSNATFVLLAQLLPSRCDFQRSDGVITACSGSDTDIAPEAACDLWADRPGGWYNETPDYFDDFVDLYAHSQNLRPEAIVTKGVSTMLGSEFYETTVIFNENPTVALSNLGDFVLLFGVLLLAMYGLAALRGEAIRLVLDPLQRMLKIVLRYAENPLSQDAKGRSGKGDDDSTLDVVQEEIGNYETEQLINAITKIADLLRKCWGVAGAGIISSNLARTQDGKTVVFNPTVPGKRVYALFGFVAINGFSEQLRALDRDVMILINDVAKVVHDEVYRWALGDHGQCNKNLGSAFLMVFRIGDFSEVHKKKQVATERLFRDRVKTATNNRGGVRRRQRAGGGTRPAYGGRRGGRNPDADGQLHLGSLPGIQSFTDRALLGMLKSFAGVHRDKQLNEWKTDFRLSAGVSDYHVDIIYGMDAGWAVEGAVGSEYKIDATYLSPHVNMASRMMSATRQYGVTILLSKAVQELLSLNCREKLRHLDTVYVKGSKVKQEIFTFDARYQGVDFFLLERTPEQADEDAESYSPNIWDIDQDLRAMRQHVSDEFMETFRSGVKKYLAGNWKEAHKRLERADQLMMETVLADGFLEYDLEEMEDRLFDDDDQGEDIVHIRQELGDGACRVLMTFMERRNLEPPNGWDAVRQLNSK
eukprot:Nitzschia sp. Nitz4//scaffold11_size288233//230845//235511//NITZ4_000808-RA/size288233-snap-gene-0.61-mRNA-1//-1//CDS//3329534176//8642//frame0